MVGDQGEGLAGQCDLRELQLNFTAAGELTGRFAVDYCPVDGCAARNGNGSVGHDIIEDDGVEEVPGWACCCPDPD